MKVRKLGDWKPRVLIFQGSPRDKDTCPNMDSKTHKIVEYIVNKWSTFINFEVIDLSVNQSKQPTIQPCKGCISTSGGFHCHFKCVAYDQRVHTSGGFVEIQNLKIGDLLQDGNIVLNHVRTSDSELVYELKLTDGRKLELTKDHKVRVLSKERFRTKESNWNYFRKEEWVELQNIKIGDNIPYMKTDNIFNDDIIYNDFLIYGLIWGDGTFVNNTPLLYVDKKESDFIKEIKLVLSDKIVSILDHKIDHSCKINDLYDEYNTEMIKINFGTELGKKMISILPKTSAKNRRLNINVFKSNSDIFNFFNGWVSTDGSITKNGINLYNTSYNCLRDAQLLLSRVGIRSNISDISHKEILVRGKKHQRTSCLVISDQKSVKIFSDNIKLLNIKKRLKLNEYFNLERRVLKHQYSKVKSIKEVGYKSVYDIEVSNSHEFNCEGINIHNCSCYFKGDDKKPDLLKELDVYTKLQQCDAFLIVSPIHWHSLTSQIKLLFDRLVCVNETLTIEDAKKLMGDDNIKNSDVTGKFARSGKYDNMLRNHLEGKVAGFYVHGDNGADDYEGKELPDSYNDVLDDGFGNNPKSTVMPYVMQLKYSGVYVPNELIEAFYINEGVNYNLANKNFNKEKEFFDRANSLLENLLTYLEENKFKNKI